ncbi:hypothetical protein BpHYR1_035083 [Brachionus plicatilis]|uniref:Uncharacterized protein n=1 Tax=Brachionus plicatilis TaxID=10195 RepID=A0A3M7SZ50_BRAPC|nr:hypothetical protein BpHYR1_035083 [Brachionus plicatilis]
MACKMHKIADKKFIFLSIASFEIITLYLHLVAFRFLYHGLVLRDFLLLLNRRFLPLRLNKNGDSIHPYLIPGNSSENWDFDIEMTDLS